MLLEFSCLRFTLCGQTVLLVVPSSPGHQHQDARPLFHRAHRSPEGYLNGFGLSAQQTVCRKGVAKATTVPLEAVIV
jgi:hypothetical protein